MITVLRQIHGHIASNGKVIHVLAAMVLTLPLMAIQLMYTYRHIHRINASLMERKFRRIVLLVRNKRI